jgi:hypothetical protein
MDYVLVAKQQLVPKQPQLVYGLILAVDMKHLQIMVQRIF